MSYESQMLSEYKMPTKEDVETALLKSLFRHNGTITEFTRKDPIVNELADEFQLDAKQRTVVLERIYKKENRIVKSPLWLRLLYRAAASLTKEKLISNPNATRLLTSKQEWMLTENGYDRALKLLDIPKAQKEFLTVKSFEVEKVVKKLIETSRPENYNPIDEKEKTVKITKEAVVRLRGFRQAVIEAYDYKCAFCGMKIHTPHTSLWEVQAAHIVPNDKQGRDDVLNGISLCRLHHWAFDVGWFTLQNDFTIMVSSKVNSLPADYGRMGEYDFIRGHAKQKSKILLPKRKEIYPHQNAMTWHRENVFFNH